jgi:hypothetical protein
MARRCCRALLAILGAVDRTAVGREAMVAVVFMGALGAVNCQLTLTRRTELRLFPQCIEWKLGKYTDPQSRACHPITAGDSHHSSQYSWYVPCRLPCRVKWELYITQYSPPQLLPCPLSPTPTLTFNFHQKPSSTQYLDGPPAAFPLTTDPNLHRNST